MKPPSKAALFPALQRLQTLCRPVRQAVSNVSLGRVVVASWCAIRCASCGPSNRAVCGLPLARLPSPGPVCPGAWIAPDRGKPLAFGICHAPCLLPVLPGHRRRRRCSPFSGPLVSPHSQVKGKHIKPFKQGGNTQ